MNGWSRSERLNQPRSVGNTAVEWNATGSTRAVAEFLAGLTSAERDSPEGIREQKYWATVKGDFAEWKRLDGLPSNADRGELGWSQAIEAAMVLAAHGDLTGARTRLGNHPAQLRSTLEHQPANAAIWGGLALMEALLGEHEAARRDARRAVELVPESRDGQVGPAHRYYLATVYAWTGDKEQAVAELAHLLRVPAVSGSGSAINPVNPISVHTLHVAPEFAPLRGDPRFEALLNDPKNNAPLF